MAGGEMRRRHAGVSALGILVFVLLLALALAAANVGYMHYTLARTIRERPELSKQPVPLPSAPVLDARGTKLNCADIIELEVPWGRPEGEKCAWSSGDVFLFFRWTDGREIRLGRPETAIDRFAREENGDPSDRSSRVEECFGGLTETRYDAMARILSRMPRRPGLFDFNQLFCEHFVIRWKEMVLGPEPTAIYSFATEVGRGFQIGDPARSREVWVHFYDGQDEHHCLAILGSPEGPAMTQSEIDFIVRSIRRAPEEPRAPVPARGATPSGKSAAKH